MIQLRDLLLHVRPKQVLGDLSVPVTEVTIDSRQAAAGVCFIALRGSNTDGHRFIPMAVAAGAAAIICEALPEEPSKDVCFVVVPDSAEAAGLIADAFYGNPSAAMQVVGVTGTNGKTTVTTLLYQLFTDLGYCCGLISTVQNRIAEGCETATHTTPDALSVHHLLARMQQAGCTHVFMEVSSHAIHQRRIAGIRFAGGVFTNITHDHLDYHKTFDEYIRVKKRFFDDLPSSAFALSNLDDKRGAVMLQNTKAEKSGFSLYQPAPFKGKVLENNLSGLVLDMNGTELHGRLIGTFNAYNLLAAYGVALLLGEEKHVVLEKLSNLPGAPGRFETYRSPKEGILGIVDYAHTPDALINVLATINQLRREGQQLISIVGCGGDRDKTKRPIMAQAACEHSTRAILTSDNPRSEDPEVILNEMEAGLNTAQRRKALRIADRKEAIKTAVIMAHPGDIILLAGKGHESYQEVKGIRHHFDDREILNQTFQLLDK
ncbi:MAG: UDP-N-acetylmuramoyl-L-alanyl-D-glutamate--2,6-diaminopimelate ligase [Bacteroidetes bacterium]|nr:UDP-N-acetylmuramoyl-L-alanyl-D-glutamate--2,6-diaminopimelate ligase [Bacteroidota bacterium]